MVQVWRFIRKIHDTSDFSAVPICFWLNENVLRIYYSTRNENNESIPYFFDYDFVNERKITNPKTINLEKGELGTFDDSGVMPSSVIKIDDKIYMYYIGWNLGVTVPFRNSIGLAVSYNNGVTFVKKFTGPVLDRTKNEPHFVASNHVIYHEEKFKMWYLSCVKWEEVNGEIRHFYNIKYATSNDGENWTRNNTIAIDFKYENEYAISVPRVIIEEGIFKMWYSYRGGPISENYRIGYAESLDGVNWERKDEFISFELSNEDWDSEMICYPFIFLKGKDKFMLYNGNHYGKTGIGLFQLI